MKVPTSKAGTPESFVVSVFIWIVFGYELIIQNSVIYNRKKHQFGNNRIAVSSESTIYGNEMLFFNWKGRLALFMIDGLRSCIMQP